MSTIPTEPIPTPPPEVPPGLPPDLPQPPIEEPEPDVFPDEVPNPNPDENDKPPKHMKKQVHGSLLHWESGHGPQRPEKVR